MTPGRSTTPEVTPGEHVPLRRDHLAHRDERALHGEERAQLGLGGLYQDRILQLVDLGVELVEHREEAVDQAVDDQIGQCDLIGPDRRGTLVAEAGTHLLHGPTGSPPYGDHEMHTEDEVDLLDRGAIPGRPVDHHVGHRVVVLDLRPLAEGLDVVDHEVVNADVVQQEIAGLVVDAVEVEPEEIGAGQGLPDGRRGGLGGGAVDGEDAVHLTSLPHGPPPPVEDGHSARRSASR